MGRPRTTGRQQVRGDDVTQIPDFTSILRSPYQTQYLKRYENPREPAFIRRTVTVLLIAWLCAYLLHDVMFMVLGSGYVIMSLIWCRMIAAVPEEIDHRLLGLLGLWGMAANCCFIGALALAFQIPDKAIGAATVLAAAGAMLNTLSYRTEDALLLLLDTIMLAACLVIFIGQMMLSDTPRENVVVFAIVVIAVFGFFVQALGGLRSMIGRLTRAQMAEAEREKLQSLGQLTSGVSHDFNNHLTVILGNLELRREQGATQDPLLDEVETAADNARILVAQLLAYSRKSDLTPRATDLEGLLHKSAVMIRRLLPATHKLTIVAEHRLPLVLVDPGKLENVVINLVNNARDAMEEGGEIVVALYDRRLREPIPLGSGGGAQLMPGEYVELRISDQGHGIPAAMLAKVLEPYFTTKPLGKGSGLGLAMAAGFAEQTGGGLLLESVEGKGTDVRLFLPVVGE